MAEQGRKLDDATKRTIARLREVLSVRATAKEAMVNKSTVIKYSPKKESGRRTA